MRISFVDHVGWDYDADTPWIRPLGGSQSALCYLAAALAADGHEVTMFNHAAAARVVRGVETRPLSSGTKEHFARQDAVVRLNSAARPQTLGADVPAICWTQHAADQRTVKVLSDPAIRDAWDGFAFVSDWQRQDYARAFGAPRAPVRVMRNAAAPAFAGQSLREGWIARGDAPALAYLSTPYRGLEVLLLALPTIRKAIPGLKLHVWAGMATYNVPADEDEYAWMYELARALPGVEMHGPVAQAELAAVLGAVDVFAYPSIFAETSCIAAIEALVSGLYPVVHDLGALRETLGGNGTILPIPSRRAHLVRGYADAVVAAIRAAEADPAAWEAERARRAAWAGERYDWRTRAREWAAFIEEIR